MKDPKKKKIKTYPSNMTMISQKSVFLLSINDQRVCKFWSVQNFPFIFEGVQQRRQVFF